MRNEETVIPGKQRRLSDRYKLPTPFCFSAIIGDLKRKPHCSGILFKHVFYVFCSRTVIHKKIPCKSLVL